MEVAFVTCRKLPAMHADDRLAADVLRDRGIPVVSAVWDDPAVDWRQYGCVVIRSAWDYILSLSPSPLLYARVDGVERNGHFMLMALEINEPYLFIGSSPGAAVRLAEAIEAVIGEGLSRCDLERGGQSPLRRPRTRNMAHNPGSKT